MKKIYLIRANKTKFGGAENYLSRLSYQLEKNQIKNQVINSIFPKFLMSWLRVVLFNIQVCINKKEKFYFSLERITCPDIYRAGDGVHKEFLKTKSRKFNPLNLVYLYLEKRCFENAQKIIANSNMIKQQIINTYQIDSAKISVVYNGIEIKKSDYEKSLKKLSSEFKIDKNKKIILFVGSGFERKGVDAFLQILSKVESNNFLAFIVGKEKKIEYYKDRAKNLNLEKKVIFTGSRSDVDDFYTISDIFLFPTTYEPFSNVVLEAMSFNNAIFTTKQNGASEILEKEYIMENSTDFSIVSKIEELLKNEIKLKDIKKRNFEIVQNFTIDKNAKETMEVISEYLN